MPSLVEIGQVFLENENFLMASIHLRDGTFDLNWLSGS